MTTRTTRNPKRRSALKHSTTRLLRDDYREVNRLCVDFKKGEGTVIRELVHEALKIRRIRRAGRDETTAPVRDAQREIVQSELTEMKVQVKEILDVQDRLLGMLDDLQNGLAPLLFELMFDTWVDAKTTHEIVVRHVLLPNATEKDRQGRTLEEYASHLNARAQELARARLAKYRDALAENPAASRRYSNL